MGTGNYSKILKQERKKYFLNLPIVDIEQKMKTNYKDLSENIQLKVSINQIKKGSFYKIKIFYIIENEKQKLNEIIDCTNQNEKTTNLNTQILIRYYFEKEQPLLFQIIRKDSNNEIINEINTTLGCIIGSRKNTLEKKIFHDEILILKVEKLEKNEDVINVEFEIKAIKQDKQDIFKDIKYKIYYEILSDKVLYESECINDEGKFSPIKIPVVLFQNINKKINIKFYKSGRKIRGNFILKISEFINDKIFEPIRVNGTYFQIKSKSRLKKNYTFFDYINAEMEIGLSVAIDFTGSNGLPSHIDSLHYINGKQKNQYERAIVSCGNILEHYDKDKKFPCFGFGAKINNKFKSIFNLNFKKDPKIENIQGIIEEYHNSINIVELYGPTFFAPIIKKMKKIIEEDREYNEYKYHILMILTDGTIDDMESTKDELVEMSSSPLSIIIIGVGQANFTSMIELDSDEKPLINSKGEKAGRDLVQFVPFLQYESNPKQLAHKVLEEIPRQVIEYYELKNTEPIDLTRKSKK